MKKNILEKSKKLKKEAEEIIYKKTLLKLIQKVGEPMVYGSVDLDLMAYPDIDIMVKVKSEKDVLKIFSLGEKIIKKFSLAWLTFSNHKFRPDSPMNKGFYYGIRILYNKIIWKIDLWFYDNKTFEKKKIEYLKFKEQIEKVDRKTVLRLKEYYYKNYKTDSKIVYDAILKKNIKTITEFKKILK